MLQMLYFCTAKNKLKHQKFMKRLFILIAVTGFLFSCSNSSQAPATDDSAAQINAADDNHTVFENDMENVASLPAYWINSKVVVKMDEVPAHSGNFASKLDATEKYSITFREYFSNINARLPKRVVVNGWYYLPEANKKSGMVMDINENNQTYIWKAYNFSDVSNVTGQWQEFTAYYTIDQPIKPEHQIKIFASGFGEKLFIDDLKISFEY